MEHLFKYIYIPIDVAFISAYESNDIDLSEYTVWRTSTYIYIWKERVFNRLYIHIISYNIDIRWYLGSFGVN